MNLYAATAILFLSSAQAQQIQSPTPALTTYVPTEGSADGEQVAEAIQPMNSLSMSMQTAQIIEAFGYGSKSSKTGGHGYGGYGAYDSKSAKKGSGYSSGSSAKGGKTGGSGDGYGSGSDSKSAKGGHGGYGGYGGGGYGAAIEVPLQQSTFEIDETSATPAAAKGGKTGGSYDGGSYGDSKSAKGSGYGSAKSGKGGYSAAVASPVEVEETSASDVPDVGEIVDYLSSLLAELLDDEGQADAVKPAAFDLGAIYDIIDHFLNGYGSKSSKSKSGKRF